ncbi:hypothetical protein EYF80_028725 [Liparis tanakae]|uniref:Uncharacterized protein n=1 Tax=Liparis tanakae TaxID=230148 RepID=A0A4Z2H8H8_9TELE|nr:hypothetical protein EYF80_028725 [Liparis tanakae]
MASESWEAQAVVQQQLIMSMQSCSVGAWLQRVLTRPAPLPGNGSAGSCIRLQRDRASTQTDCRSIQGQQKKAFSLASRETLHDIRSSSPCSLTCLLSRRDSACPFNTLHSIRPAMVVSIHSSRKPWSDAGLYTGPPSSSFFFWSFSDRSDFSTLESSHLLLEVCIQRTPGACGRAIVQRAPIVTAGYAEEEAPSMQYCRRVSGL